MIYISFNEILKKWKSTFIISICISFIMFFGIVLISVYESECGIYNMFKKVMRNQKGDVVIITNEDLNNRVSSGIDSVIKQTKSIPGIKQVHFGRTTSTFITENNKNRNVREIGIIGLEKSFWSYKPELIDGVWIDDIDIKEEDVVGIVISDNKLGYKVGDIVELPNCYDMKNWDWYNGSAINSTIKFKICGIYSKKSLVYYSSNNMPLLNLNQSMNSVFFSLEEMESYNSKLGMSGFLYEALAYTTRDEMEKCMSFYDNVHLTNTIQNNLLVDYKDDITDEEIEECRKFFNRIGAKNFVSYEEMDDLNYREIEVLLMRFYPLAIASAILGLIAIISMAVIITKSELKTYSILYSIGMNWKSAVVINNIQVLISSVLAYIISASFYNIIKIIKPDNSITFALGVDQNLYCIIVALLIVLISSLAPLIMLDRTSPIDVYRKLEV